MQSCIQLPIGKEDDFKGIIDLFEMKAYIYNDDKGDDISVVDIPEDMKDDAELYRSELVEKICELDDDFNDGCTSRARSPANEELKKVAEDSYLSVCRDSGMLRYLLTGTRESRSCWMRLSSSCLLH